MNDVDKFINRENIGRFAEAYWAERDSSRNVQIRRLLVEEENRFGYYSEQVQITSWNIKRCNDLIAKQQSLVADLRQRGGDPTLAEAMLNRLFELRSLFKQFHATVTERCDAVAV